MTDNIRTIQDKFDQVGGRSGRSIQIRPDALHLIATEGENALLEAGSPFYVRGGLVKPVVDEIPAAHGKRAKVARLCEVDADCLVDHLSRAASWVRYNIRKKEWTPTDPPRNIAQMILSRDGEWKFRRLAGVITTPTLRPDGTILSEAGYDEATQLLLMEPPKLPPIPESPTREDAAKALNTLLNLLQEFPFVDEASRAVAVSALITPVVRGAVPVAPLHGTTAPVAGSGKSYIIDLAAAISSGERAPAMAAGRNEEETEKRLAAALLNGQSIISIDNVNGDLGGDLLCQMIERPIVSIRPLGSSKLAKIESRATVYATGNNIHMVGDMTRRVVICSLDPNVERPELREFKVRPFDLVIANRGHYIAAALLIVRAYAVAGYPAMCHPLASFEDWSRIVRSALVWLGMADPVETMKAAREDDPDTSALRGLLNVWRDCAGTNTHSAAQVIARADERNPYGERTFPDLYQALLEVADDGRGVASAKRLGKYLTRHKGRILDGLKFSSRDDSHAKIKVWCVMEAAQ